MGDYTHDGVLFLMKNKKVKHIKHKKHTKYGIHHTECPKLTLDDMLTERSLKDYSKEAQRVIKMITVQEGLEPVGSSKYKAHKYPSDIDLFEPVKGCCTVNKVRQNLARSIQKIIRNILDSKDIFFSKFQAGYDRRYDIYWGTEKDGQVLDYNVNIVKREIDNLHYQGLLTQNQYKKALTLAKDNPSVREYHNLYYFFRKFMALEWSPEEILRGYKEALGNKRIYLDDALIDNSLVKLDVWAELPFGDLKGGKRYVEITNWFLVQVEDTDGNIQTLSIVQQDRKQSLKADIYKYAKSDPLKASKRYWNYLLEIETAEGRSKK